MLPPKPEEESKKEEKPEEQKTELMKEEAKHEEETKVTEPAAMDLTEEKVKAEEMRKEMAAKAMEEVLGEKQSEKKEEPTDKENVGQPAMVSKTAEDIEMTKAKTHGRKRRASSEELHIQATKKRQGHAAGKKVTAA